MREQANKPEGLDIELYGHRCPEVDWLTEEEREQLMNGEFSRPLNQGSASKLPVYMALKMEDQVAFINMLGKLKLEVTNTGPVMEGHAPEHMTYWGISAIDMLAKLKQQDLGFTEL